MKRHLLFVGVLLLFSTHWGVLPAQRRPDLVLGLCEPPSAWSDDNVAITFEATPPEGDDPVETTGDNEFEYFEFAAGIRISPVVTMATVSSAAVQLFGEPEICDDHSILPVPRRESAVSELYGRSRRQRRHDGRCFGRGVFDRVHFRARRECAAGAVSELRVGAGVVCRVELHRFVFVGECSALRCRGAADPAP